jgi:hypothetical protein
MNKLTHHDAVMGLIKRADLHPLRDTNAEEAEAPGEDAGGRVAQQQA